METMRRGSRFTFVGQDIARNGRGSNATMAGSGGFSRVHRSTEPWWTQLDSYPVASEEDIMDHFIHSTEMNRLEKLALKKFQLDSEHVEILATLKTADATAIMGWHDKVADFIRHRQTVSEKIRARDTLSQRLRQKKSIMIAMVPDEEEEGEENDEVEEDGDDEASNSGDGGDDSPGSPVAQMRKSEVFHMPPETQADLAARQMLTNRRSSQTSSQRRSSTLSPTSPRSDGHPSPRQRLQTAGANVLGTMAVVKKLNRRSSAGRTEGDGKPASREAPVSRKSSMRGSRVTRFA